jgi:initiation factor 1A|tara:strand:- start:4093 stop:4662 length:570 start_codon:yes stop_codon:yes gene_type:complete
MRTWRIYKFKNNMPKGGRNTKKKANKNAQPSSHARVRIPKLDDEMFGKVIAIHGGSHADVLCNDKKTRLLCIPGKFSGRNKRDNMLHMDTIVLIGLRSWEVIRPGKKQKADLLYVYSKGQMDSLKLVEGIRAFIFPPGEMVEGDDDNGIDISNTETWEQKMDETITENVKVSLNINQVEGDEEFDFDDI